MGRRPPPRSGAVRPPLTIAQILAWADDHYARTGRWPTAASGPILAAPSGTWSAVNVALRRGHRGLPGGDTLARLLARERGVPPQRGRPAGRLSRYWSRKQDASDAEKKSLSPRRVHEP